MLHIGPRVTLVTLSLLACSTQPGSVNGAGQTQGTYTDSRTGDSGALTQPSSGDAKGKAADNAQVAPAPAADHGAVAATPEAGDNAEAKAAGSNGAIPPPASSASATPAAVKAPSVLSPVNGNANLLEFKIPAGTAQKPWNTADTMISAKVGQTIRFTNNDKIVHQLHTFGQPCPHGTPINPGTSVDCVLAAPADSVAKPGILYDHIVGNSAMVYMKITN